MRNAQCLSAQMKDSWLWSRLHCTAQHCETDFAVTHMRKVTTPVWVGPENKAKPKLTPTTSPSLLLAPDQ